MDAHIWVWNTCGYVMQTFSRYFPGLYTECRNETTRLLYVDCFFSCNNCYFHYFQLRNCPFLFLAEFRFKHHISFWGCFFRKRLETCILHMEIHIIMQQKNKDLGVWFKCYLAVIYAHIVASSFVCNSVLMFFYIFLTIDTFKLFLK